MTALVALAAIAVLGGLTAWALWLARRPHPELRAARKDLQ